VLLPHERIPLHIFEPRYRELIGECIETGGEFGVVLSDGDGLRAVGTRAAVLEVLERFPDGRLNVVVEGRERFRVVAPTAGRSFDTAEVDDLTDPDGAEEPTRAELAECLDAFRRVAEAAEAPTEELDTSEHVAFRIAGWIDFGAGEKQELLELRSERERVARLTRMLEEAVEAVGSRRARERASGNGQRYPAGDP
jgi:ATP-dependent Lon protease